MVKRHNPRIGKQLVPIVDSRGHASSRWMNVDGQGGNADSRAGKLGKSVPSSHRDEAAIRRQSEDGLANTPPPRPLSQKTIDSLESDGRSAARAAFGYLTAADKIDLTESNWESITALLKLYAHNESSEDNVWQPVNPADQHIFIVARDAEMLDLLTVRAGRRIKNRVNEIIHQGTEIGEGMRDLDRERYNNLTDEKRAIYDGLALLGLRRAYGMVPGWASDAVVKQTGVVGAPLRSVTGRINTRARSLTVLQRMAAGDKEYSEQARRLLEMLEISNKGFDQLVDEIVQKKKGKDVAENDIRTMLENRTHLELVRFRSELD